MSMRHTLPSFQIRLILIRRYLNYRPISLTTTLYKLLAKVLTEMLKPTLIETIAENQSAFIKGRQITDAILIANEAIDMWKCAKKKGVIIKLDVEKAFDKISWDFINTVLFYKGYPPMWRKWIRELVSPQLATPSS